MDWDDTKKEMIFGGRKRDGVVPSGQKVVFSALPPEKGQKPHRHLGD
jgi:hypothetical protein